MFFAAEPIRIPEEAKANFWKGFTIVLEQFWPYLILSVIVFWIILPRLDRLIMDKKRERRKLRKELTALKRRS